MFTSIDQLPILSHQVLAFYIPKDAIADFILSNISAILLGIVISINIYVLNPDSGTVVCHIPDTSDTCGGGFARQNCTLAGQDINTPYVADQEDMLLCGDDDENKPVITPPPFIRNCWLRYLTDENEQNLV